MKTIILTFSLLIMVYFSTTASAQTARPQDQLQYLGKYRIYFDGLIGNLLGPSIEFILGLENKVKLRAYSGKFDCNNGHFTLNNGTIIGRLRCTSSQDLNFGLEDCNSKSTQCVRIITTTLNFTNSEPKQSRDLLLADLDLRILTDSLFKSFTTKIERTERGLDTFAAHLNWNIIPSTDRKLVNSPLKPKFEINLINGKQLSFRSLTRDFECSESSFVSTTNVIISQLYCTDFNETVKDNCDGLNDQKKCLKTISLIINSPRNNVAELMTSEVVNFEVLSNSGKKSGSAILNRVTDDTEIFDPFEK